MNNRNVVFFWVAIAGVAAACATFVSRAQQAHQITITSDAPLSVEGGGKVLGAFAPPPPEFAIHESCEADRIVTGALADGWNNGGVERNVRNNRNFASRAGDALFTYCAAGRCDGLDYRDGYLAAHNGWLLWWYQNEIVTARGGGDRCGVFVRCVFTGPQRNQASKVLYCPSSGVCAGVVRELHDVGLLEPFETACTPAQVAAAFDHRSRGGDVEALPDPAFNMAITGVDVQ